MVRKSRGASAPEMSLFFGKGFLHDHVGQIVDDPTIAISELVANCYDAGADEVHVRWPNLPGETVSVTDNGTGMTRQEFELRWRTLSRQAFLLSVSSLREYQIRQASVCRIVPLSERIPEPPPVVPQVSRIERTMTELIDDTRDGYAAGFKAATLVNHDKPDAKEEERCRVIGILAAIRENASIQEIVDLIPRDD